MEYSVRIGLLAGGPGIPYGLSYKIPPEGETQMAFSLYDAAVTPCVQQLSALAGIIDKAGAHFAANKIEESALLQDRLYPDMFCLARQIRQAADFAMNTGGRLAGVTPPRLAGCGRHQLRRRQKPRRNRPWLREVPDSRTGGWRGGQGYRLDCRRQRSENEGQRLSATVRPTEFLLLCNDGIRHPASSRRTARKAGLPRPGQLALGRLEIDHSCDRKRARVEEDFMIIRYLSLVAAARRGDQSQGA